MNFDSELKKGNFLVGKCTKCKKNIWPPSDYCSKCFNKITWKRSSGKAKIIEFSSKRGIFFCVAEFEKGVKVVGKLKTKKEPQIGQNVKLKKCTVNNGKYIFEMLPLK